MKRISVSQNAHGYACRSACTRSQFIHAHKTHYWWKQLSIQLHRVHQLVHESFNHAEIWIYVTFLMFCLEITNVPFYLPLQHLCHLMMRAGKEHCTVCGEGRRYGVLLCHQNKVSISNEWEWMAKPSYADQCVSLYVCLSLCEQGQVFPNGQDENRKWTERVSTTEAFRGGQVCFRAKALGGNE